MVLIPDSYWNDMIHTADWSADECGERRRTEEEKESVAILIKRTHRGVVGIIIVGR